MAVKQNKYVTVVIDIDTKTKKIKPVADAHLKFNQPTEPDSVRWEIKRFPAGAKTVMIKWEVDSPFLHLGAEPADGKTAKAVLIGTGNTRVEGLFKYSVLFLSSTGNIVTGVDPRIINDPVP